MVDCYWLLLLGQKSNLIGRFKFEPITTNQLWFFVKMLWNIMGIAFLKKLISLSFFYKKVSKNSF